MMVPRFSSGIALATLSLTAVLAACSSSSSVATCGSNGATNGVCLSGTACPNGSTSIPLVSSSDQMTCPSTAATGLQVCCTPPVDSGMPASGSDAGDTGSTMPGKDATSPPDAKKGIDASGKPDATTAPDATTTPDATTQPDATSLPDAASDGSTTPDAKSTVDGSADAAVDGKATPDAGVDATSKDGSTGTLLADGVACTGGTDCMSGHCATGVCCNVGCTGTCQACTSALTGGADGTCADVKLGTAPSPASQCVASPPCGNIGTCNGAGACELAPATTSCGTASCANGSERGASVCSGTGSCDTGVSVSCGAYACNAGGTACLTSCSSDAQCASGDFCQNPGATGVCTPQLATGTACTAADQCTSGYCGGSPSKCQATSCTDGVKDGTETGIDCGGSCPACETVLLVAVGSGGVSGAELHPTAISNGTWSAGTSLGDSATDPPALTLTGTTGAAGLVTTHSASAGSLLMYATWTPGAWTQLASVGAGITTLRAPSIGAFGSTAFVAFLGTDNKHYVDSFAAAAWSGVQPVTNGGNQASGPTPAGLAALASTDVLLAYFDSSNDPTAQEELAGAWQAPVALGTDQSYVSTPAVVALTGGTADAMVAFGRQSDGAVLYTTRTAGVWATDVQIVNAFAFTDSSYGPVEHLGLAPLAGGGAVLAFRGTDGGLYYSVYTAGVWAPVAAFSTPNVSPIAPPSVARGVAGATAEIAFVESDGVAYHARLVSGAWTVPVAVVGSSFASVAISTGP